MSRDQMPAVQDAFGTPQSGARPFATHVCVDQIQGDELRVPGPSLNNGSRKTEQNASPIISDRIRRKQFGLSGSPSQSFETDDGLKLSSKIRGSFASEYVVDLVNCMATGSLQGNVI